MGGRPRKDEEKTLPVTGPEGFSENGDDVSAESPEKAAKKKQARERESAAATAQLAGISAATVERARRGGARRGFPCRRSRARGPSSTWRDSLHSGTFCSRAAGACLRGYRARVPNRPFHRPQAAFHERLATTLSLARVRLRAQRRYGELLGPAEARNFGAGQPQPDGVTRSHAAPGDRKSTQRARAIADVPEPVFETFLEQGDPESALGYGAAARRAQALK